MGAAGEVRAVWAELLDAVAARHQPTFAVLELATVWDVQDRVVVLRFPHMLHAHMVAEDPSVVVGELGRLLGGVWELRCGTHQRGVVPPFPVRRVPPAEQMDALDERRWDLESAGQPTGPVDLAIEVAVEQHRLTLDGLVQWAGLAVESFCAEHADALAALPAAVAQGLIVRATVAYLYAQGLMVPAPPDALEAHPIAFDGCVPEHLRPDVAEALVRHQTMVGPLRAASPDLGSRGWF